MIYKIVTDGKIFKIQKKGLFSWVFITEVKCDMRGESYEAELSFSTQEEAEKWISGKKPKVWKVVKEIEYEE